MGMDIYPIDLDTVFGCDDLPWDDIGMMFDFGEEYCISFDEES